MKKRLYILSAILFVSIIFNSVADDNKPIRIGLKIGYPSFIGGTAEYILPLMNNTIGIGADLSYLPSLPLSGYLPSGYSGVDAKTAVTYMYWNIGLNYYFFGNGKGLYAGLGMGRTNFKIELTNVQADNLQVTYQGVTGTVDITDGNINFNYGVSMTGLKLGYKWVPGNFTTGLDLGYVFYSYDKTADISGYAIARNSSSQFSELKQGTRVDFSKYTNKIDVQESMKTAPKGSPTIGITLGFAF